MVSARTLLFASLCMSAQNTFALGSGDLAFTALNADEDGWSIVALTDLAAHSKIHFTDSSWDGAAFTSAEGFHTWDTGASGIAAGSVIRFSRIDQASRAVSIGSLTSSGNAALSSTAETLYAYVGSGPSAPASFLAAISTEPGAAATVAITAAGLRAGVDALILPASTDYSEYTGARSGEANYSDYRMTINDAGNWTGFIDGNHAETTPRLVAFSVSAVPEASGGWMMLAGLAVVAARRRR